MTCSSIVCAIVAHMEGNINKIALSIGHKSQYGKQQEYNNSFGSGLLSIIEYILLWFVVINARLCALHHINGLLSVKQK